MKLDKIDILLACTAGLLLPVGFIVLAPIGILLYRFGRKWEKENEVEFEYKQTDYNSTWIFAFFNSFWIFSIKRVALSCDGFS